MPPIGETPGGVGHFLVAQLRSRSVARGSAGRGGLLERVRTPAAPCFGAVTPDGAASKTQCWRLAGAPPFRGACYVEPAAIWDRRWGVHLQVGNLAERSFSTVCRGPGLLHRSRGWCHYRLW
ncbi:hypothetical protein NDU88_000014 [Pleurodeles waltl]|uniref:Uncharacterized protein n=1 Tax=Pleurodeles waltl TaxID=8319 RepID=A0AAV7VTD3_PLEWA|nr:hypothetical protein NDU88_000014 [Pleurodeles waltl]